MFSYIPLADYSKQLSIKEGEHIFISSDAKTLMLDALENDAPMDLNLFIDGLINAVGNNGTIVFPTYNWDFCRGKPFHYQKTLCKTGALGTLALKRKDFRRTRHPIYSFAVYGQYQKDLCAMKNTDSFGGDSPFSFMHNHNFINYIIDVPFHDCFTFLHYVEEVSGVVSYRYMKDFTADYTYDDNITEQRTYSMFVRDLDKNVESTVDPIEADFLMKDVELKFKVNNSEIKRVDLAKAFPIVLNDILHNNARKLCRFKGQD